MIDNMLIWRIDEYFCFFFVSEMIMKIYTFKIGGNFYINKLI